MTAIPLGTARAPIRPVTARGVLVAIVDEKHIWARTRSGRIEMASDGCWKKNRHATEGEETGKGNTALMHEEYPVNLGLAAGASNSLQVNVTIECAFP